MHNTIRIKHITDYQKVCYYSVCVDQDEKDVDDAESLFELFLRIHEETDKAKCNHILAWLMEIGIKYGAVEHFFRPEQNNGQALGLPPKQYSKSPSYVEDGKPSPNNLRLYCHRLNPHVVILFSGGLKSASKSQDCPIVRSHFEMANRLTNLIDEAIRAGDINWINEYTDIAYSEDLTLYLKQ